MWLQPVHCIPGRRLVRLRHLAGVEGERLAGVERDEDGASKGVDAVATIAVLEGGRGREGLGLTV